jgi:hypothetical protein
MHPREKGQALPLTVLFLFVLLGIVSLVVDAGMAYSYRRYMQNAADAAVLAGGALMAKGINNDAQIVSTATYYAQANRANSLTIQYLDAAGNVLGVGGTGAVPANSVGIRVVASYQYTPGFAAVLGIGPMNITASAKGGVRGGGGSATILALSSTACAGLNATGSGTITALNGNIHANATCSQAINQTGSGHLRASNGQITVVGGYRKTGSGTAVPTPITGAASVPDPMAGLLPPNIGSYPVRHGTATAPSTWLFTGSTARTLDPGVYYGGIKSTASGTITLRPGVYIMAGGKFQLTGSGALIADGVFIYVTNDPTHPTGDGAYASVNVEGSLGSRITGMSSGPYKNLAIFQDRANTNDASITGSGDMVSGTFYFPSAHLTMTGSGSLSGTAQLITNSIDLAGSGNMTFTHDTSKFYGMPQAIIVQ